MVGHHFLRALFPPLNRKINHPKDGQKDGWIDLDHNGNKLLIINLDMLWK